MRLRQILPAVSLLMSALAAPTFAAWPNQPTVNLPICTTANNQQAPVLVPDGVGGALIAWSDARGASFDIYSQHVLPSGVVDPAWPANGRALCVATNNQQYPAIVSDGAGGAIVAWNDMRGGVAWDIYARHVFASGVLDPAWPVDGRAICTAAGSQESLDIISDGSGGAIITWWDSRLSANYDIYAQHVLANGTVDAAWPTDGRALCVAAGNQIAPTIVSDGTGGAIIAWNDLRSGVSNDIYAQHVQAGGAADPAWPVDGRAVCTATSQQYRPTIVSDGAGGAIVTWYDLRGGSNYDIYAQHVLASGFPDPAWPADGRALCTAANSQYDPELVTDGAGGAIVTWYDSRSGTNYDIYAQHVLASGVADPAWPADGRALCAAASDQTVPTIVADGSGGAIVSWQDFRGGAAYDIYAQHVLASGAVDPTWPVDGRAISTATNAQVAPASVSDGAGGSIVVWQDLRSSYYDIYAQRVARYGYLGTPEAEIVSVKDVPADNGGKVKVSWNASYLDIAGDANLSAYDVLRSVPNYAAALARVGRAREFADGQDAEAPSPGELFVTRDGAQAYYWEYLATVSALHYVSGYSYLAATAQDSTSAGALKTAFMVVARNAGNTMYWPSRPDSGYSVDNLPPYAPGPVVGTYMAGTATLHWNPNTEPDLANYRLYRGTSSTFVPGPANLVGAPTDTAYVDAAAAPYYYKLTAIDVHGNESPATLVLPSGALAVDGALPSQLAFAAPAPNPARGATMLRFSLPRDASVRLALYDVSGRRVRMLAQGAQPAGEHTAPWDLRDDAGRAVGAGLYFARFEAEGRTFTQRVMTLR
jgi:hypothetical protein